MNAQQLELPISEAPGKTVSEADVAELEAWLLKAGNWTKAKDFPAPWNERSLRALANASKGRIISGQRGSLVTRLATIKEVQHAAAWLRHQAAQMQYRALEIDRVYHGKLPSRGCADAPA